MFNVHTNTLFKRRLPERSLRMYVSLRVVLKHFAFFFVSVRGAVMLSGEPSRNRTALQLLKLLGARVSHYIM